MWSLERFRYQKLLASVKKARRGYHREHWVVVDLGDEIDVGELSLYLWCAQVSGQAPTSRIERPGALYAFFAFEYVRDYYDWPFSATKVEVILDSSTEIAFDSSQDSSRWIFELDVSSAGSTKSVADIHFIRFSVHSSGLWRVRSKVTIGSSELEGPWFDFSVG